MISFKEYLSIDEVKATQREEDGYVILSINMAGFNKDLKVNPNGNGEKQSVTAARYIDKLKKMKKAEAIAFIEDEIDSMYLAEELEPVSIEEAEEALKNHMAKDDVSEMDAEKNVEMALDKVISTLSKASKSAMKLKEGDRLKKELDKIAYLIEEEIHFVSQGEYS